MSRERGDVASYLLLDSHFGKSCLGIVSSNTWQLDEMLNRSSVIGSNGNSNVMSAFGCADRDSQISFECCDQNQRRSGFTQYAPALGCRNDYSAVANLRALQLAKRGYRSRNECDCFILRL